MFESASPSPASDHGVNIPLHAVLKCSFALGLATGMWWLVGLMADSHSQRFQPLFLCGAIVAVIGLSIHSMARRWSHPMQKLVALIPQIRAGDAPMEDLEKISGGPATLVPQIREILHELRMQQAFVAELNQEMRQRVAGRTDALERKIGSLRQQAVQDGLTGLFNRRMFDERLPQIAAHCAQKKHDFSLLAIDVDNFKKLNDTLGHAAGDDLLRDIGQIIRSGIREEDAAFRLGGDEFAVVLCGAKPAAAEKLAARLVDLVDALAKPLRLNPKPRLSIGVAGMSQLGANASLKELTDLADHRLYEIKSERHRISPRLAKAG